MFDRDGGGKDAGSKAGAVDVASPGRDVPDPSPVDRALGTAGQGERVDGAVLHTDGVAADAAASLNAHAFAAGQDIYFGAGQYAPGSTGGDQLIQHEMAHVEQAAGVDVPTPGNYNVAPSSAPQEVEARQWAGGGIGEASMMADSATIYRAEIGTGVAANVVAHGGTAEAGATAGGHDGAQFNMLAARGGGQDDKDPLQAFRLAVVGGSASQALAKWAKVPAADKLHIAGEKDTLLRAMQIIGPRSLDILHDAGVDPTTEIRFAQEILWHGDGAGWKAELHKRGWAISFLQGNPRRAALDKKSLQHLEYYTHDDAYTYDAFEKAWAPLGTTDLTTNNKKFYDAIWEKDWIVRAYRALMNNHVPPSHLATANAIYISDTVDDPVGTPGPQGNMDYGYYDGAQNIVVPKYPGAGIATHDMVGGAGQKGPRMRHFESTMLHETGHLVGDQTGEWAWGKDPSSPLDMSKVTAADVQTELWDTAKNHALHGAHPNPVSEADAKLVLEQEAIGTDAFATTTWAAAGKDRHLFDGNLKKQYGGQRLYTMAKQMAGHTDGAYHKAMQGETTASHMYAYLTRFDKSWSKFKKSAWDKRVSFYSMAAPQEWFAEQYNYYMSTNGNATIPEVKTKMIDVMRRVDAAAGTPAITGPGAAAGPGATGGAGGTGTTPATPGGAGGGAQDAQPPRPAASSGGHRFAWSWG